MSTCRWEDGLNVGRNVKETVFEGADWICLAHDKDPCGIM
jgi:hypothetical protein